MKEVSLPAIDCRQAAKRGAMVSIYSMTSLIDDKSNPGTSLPTTRSSWLSVQAS
jgi:hypothetical protein